MNGFGYEVNGFSLVINEIKAKIAFYSSFNTHLKVK